MEGVKYYDITGRVVQEGNNNPLDSVKLTYDGFNDFTDKNGKFVLKVTVKVDNEGNLLDKYKFTFLTFEKEGYSTRSVLPLTGENKIKTKLNLTKLTTEKKQTEKDIAATSTVDSETTKAVAKGSVPSLPTPQKAINKAVQSIQDRLLPYIIGIVAVFGIT